MEAENNKALNVEEKENVAPHKKFNETR